MEFITLGSLIAYGTPAILLGLIISVVAMLVTGNNLRLAVNELKEAIKELKNKLVWVSNCERTHAGVDKRLDDHEARIRELERDK